MMEEAGKERSEEDISRMMELLDKSGDDIVTYEEFIEHFCKGSKE